MKDLTHQVLAADTSGLFHKLGRTSAETVAHLQKALKKGGAARLRLNESDAYASLIVKQQGRTSFRVREVESDGLVLAFDADLLSVLYRLQMLELDLRIPLKPKKNQRPPASDNAPPTLL